MKTTIENYENRILDIENFAVKRGRLLEIGSERGGFLNVMKNRGWDVEGVEISKDASDLALKNNIKTFNGIFVDFEPDSNFDSICMYQTLEHVPDPKETIQKAYSILNDNGTFIVEVPNIKCFEQKYSKKRRHLSYDLPRHLNHFSPRFLNDELKKIGFKEVVINQYPPKELLSFLNWLNRTKKNESDTNSETILNTNDTPQKNTPLALAKPTVNSKTKLIVAISKLFPGWRFTITGIK